MPRYERKCEVCEFFQETQEKISAFKTIICPRCGEKKFRKLISKVYFQIKGSSSKNNYENPPTNEELGLPSMREVKKQQEDDNYVQILQKGGNLTPLEKEIVKVQKKEVVQRKQQKDKRISNLRDKHKEFVSKLDTAMKEAKDKPRHYREQSKEKKKREGQLGTRFPKKELPKLI